MYHIGVLHIYSQVTYVTNLTTMKPINEILLIIDIYTFNNN